MTMHIEGPWLSTTGKKKGKSKFRNADQARKSRESKESWEALQKKWGLESETRKKTRAASSGTYKEPVTYRRETPVIKSLNPTNMSPCIRPADKVYTGDAIIGIGQLHKSNGVPIFSKDEAVDISKMRRG